MSLIIAPSSAGTLGKKGGWADIWGWAYYRASMVISFQIQYLGRGLYFSPSVGLRVLSIAKEHSTHYYRHTVHVTIWTHI